MYVKIRKNSFLIAIFVALSMSILIGCTKGAGTIKIGSELNTPTKMSMIYDEFNCHKETRIKVIEGQPVEVTVSIVIGNQELSISKYPIVGSVRLGVLAYNPLKR